MKGGRERIAVFLDIENMLCGARDTVEVRAAMVHVAEALNDLGARGTIVAAIASCNHFLARRVIFQLATLGVRVFIHRGGPDAADHALIARIRAELPATTDTVVIGSGDHIFAAVAHELRAQGRRVEVRAAFGCLSAELYRAADDFRLLTSA